MANVLKEFIAQHRTVILDQFLQVIVDTTPLLSPNQAAALTVKIFDYYTGLTLGQLKPTDDYVQAVVAENRSLGVTPDLGRIRVKSFFSLLGQQAEHDLQLDVLQKNHLQRMFDQSERFMLTLTLMLRPPNLSN